MKNFAKRIGGTILGLAFIFGVSALGSSTAQAQYRNDGQYHRRDRDNDRNQDWRQRQIQNQIRRDRRYENNVYRPNVYGNNSVYGNYGSYGRYGGYNNVNQGQLNQGYQYGLSTGASDAQRGQSYSPQRSHYYKNASTQAFRQGFVQGYDAGFRQYGGYGNGRYGRGVGSVLGGIFRPY